MHNPLAVDQIVALLRGVPLLAGLPDGELAWIAAGLYQHAYPAGTIITREGERTRFFSILLEGEIAVYKSLGLPEERLLTIMQAGDFFGEMSVYDDDGSGDSLNQRTASLVARQLVLVLEMPVESFKTLLNRQPGVAFRVMQVMAARLRNLESASIRDLREKNTRLAQALNDLQQAQAQIVEKEKLEHELDMARRIQERILPKELPDLPGWELRARWQPARAVSGDFYDFLPLPDGRLGLVIGDVSGKGVPASLVMATTCSVLRATARTLSGRRRTPGRRRTGATGIFPNPFKKSGTGEAAEGEGAAALRPYDPKATGIFSSPFAPPFAPQGDLPSGVHPQAGTPGSTGAPGSTGSPTYIAAPLSPGQLLAQVNEVLCRDMPPGMFAACLFGLLDPASGEFRFANAGHCLPLLLRPGAPVQELRATGMPLGLLPERDYEEQVATLAPGDRLLLYSDGLIEAHAPGGQMFGLPQLRAQLGQPAPGDLIESLLERLSAFTGPDAEQEDDVTLVTVSRG